MLNSYSCLSRYSSYLTSLINHIYKLQLISIYTNFIFKIQIYKLGKVSIVNRLPFRKKYFKILTNSFVQELTYILPNYLKPIIQTKKSFNSGRKVRELYIDFIFYNNKSNKFYKFYNRIDYLTRKKKKIFSYYLINSLESTIVSKNRYFTYLISYYFQTLL